MTDLTDNHEDASDDHTMPLWGHLESLRWVLIKGGCAVVLLALAGLFVATPLSNLLQRPLAAVDRPVELIFTTPLDAFLSRIKLALFCGVALSSPLLIWLVWGFVAPGLLERERRPIRIAVLVGFFMFLVGGLFGYRILYLGLPAIVRMGLDGGRHLWSLHSYLSFCFRFLTAFGLVFELPVILVALGRLGVINADQLRGFRSYAVIGIFLLAAILTPPDPLTQIMLGLPLLLLYEISIILVGVSQQKADS